MQLVQAKYSLIECIRNVSLITSREALDLAQDLQGDVKTSAHKIRVATKKLRATWYLLRAGAAQTPSKRAITRLRSAARQLAADRDKTVVREVLADLSSGPLGIAETLPDTEMQSARLIELLQMEQEIWLDFEPGPLNKELVIKNLCRTYRRAKKLGKRAVRKSSDYEQRRRWRKWVKYLYYQLDILEQCGLIGQTRFVD